MTVCFWMSGAAAEVADRLNGEICGGGGYRNVVDEPVPDGLRSIEGPFRCFGSGTSLVG